MGVVLKLENLKKSYNDTEVLNEINLEVKKGDVISIIGPSGTGKSTLLRCINLLEEPTKGNIFIGNDKIETLKPNKKPRLFDKEIAKLRAQVGMVFQQYNLWPHMSVLENVMTAPIMVKGKSKEKAKNTAMKMLELVQMDNKAIEYPNNLSGGQQQRVAIARALAMEPELILFDEVTSALDPLLSAEVLEVMRDLAKQGMTMLVVTHEMNFAEKVSNRVIFMADGNIVEDGTPQQIFYEAKDERTKKFLRSI